MRVYNDSLKQRKSCESLYLLKRDGQPKLQKESRLKLELIQVNRCSLKYVSATIRTYKPEHRTSFHWRDLISNEILKCWKNLIGETRIDLHKKNKDLSRANLEMLVGEYQPKRKKHQHVKVLQTYGTAFTPHPSAGYARGATMVYNIAFRTSRRSFGIPPENLEQDSVTLEKGKQCLQY
jgi:hypothetical protein